MEEPSIGDDLKTLERNTHILIDKFETVVKANAAVYKRNIILWKVLNTILSKEKINELINFYERDTIDITDTSS